MSCETINLERKLSPFDEPWAPEVVAGMDDHQFKIVKVQGHFSWNRHRDTDATFFVIEGTLRIDFGDDHVNLGKGEMYVVPKGIEHRPYAQDEAWLLLVEPRGVPRTADLGSGRAARNDVRT